MIKLTSSLCPGENIRGTQPSWAVLTSLALSRMKDGLSPRGLSDTPGNVCVKKSCETIMPIKYLRLCVNVYGFSITSTSMRCSKNLSILPNTEKMFLFSGIPPIYGHFEWGNHDSPASESG